MPLTTATAPARVDPLAVVAALGFAVLGWLTAQWATFGLLSHSHVLTPHDLHAHQHTYAAPTGAATLLITALAVGALVLRGHTGRSAPRPAPAPTWRGLAGWALVSAAVFVVVETAEFAAAGEHHLSSLAAVLGLGAGLQGASGVLTRCAALALLHALTRTTRTPLNRAPVIALHRRGPLPTSTTRAPSTTWQRATAPNRGPPALLA